MAKALGKSSSATLGVSEAMPAALAGSEPVFGSRVCRVNIIPRWLAMDLIDLSGIFFSPYRDRGFTCGIS